MAIPDSNAFSRRNFNRLLTAGIVGAASVVSTSGQAQEEDNAFFELSPEAISAYGRMVRATKDLDGFLRAIQFERTAIVGLNYFAVSMGGIDAIKDLEEGRGVDPETLAGLYSGFAMPSVSSHLNVKPVRGGGIRILSSDGRIRYKGTVVRMYSPDTLRALFDRRIGFHNDSDRIKRQRAALYVYSRKRELGELERAAEDTEITELLERYQRLSGLKQELATALQNERTLSTVLQGEPIQHIFGVSVGGLDVTEDLRTRHAVDPETLASIYAQRISTDYAASFQVGADGSILYDGVPIKLYSRKRLEWCFKVRERLELQSAVR